MMRNKKASRKTAPTPAELNDLIDHFQNGSFHLAEQSALSISRNFPKHPLSWQVLGAIYLQTNRSSEAVAPQQAVTALLPRDAEAHNNLGVALQLVARYAESEESLLKAIELNPDYPEAHNNLGITFRSLSRPADAVNSYLTAIALNPSYAEAYRNLGNARREIGKKEEAISSYRQSIMLDDQQADVYCYLGVTLLEMERDAEAYAYLKKAVEIEPNHMSATHMLNALTGHQTEGAPLEYVEKLFDEAASSFERQMVTELDYGTPKLVAELLQSARKKDSLGSILDLGCGTGLFGVEVASNSTSIIGVDLSEKMLAESRKKNIYKELHKLDVIEYLERSELYFDYYVLADVLVYFGDLSRVLGLLKERNKNPEAGLAFSTEHSNDADFLLQKSGRYSHSRNYVENLCEQFNFKLRHFELSNIRKENGRDIVGGIYLLDF